MSYTLLEEILATTTQRPPYAALHTWLLHNSWTASYLQSHASCLQCYLGTLGVQKQPPFCWMSAMRKIAGYTVCKQYGDRRYHPGVKFIKWILVPSKKADGLTERQMKINGYDNLHICDQETDLTADCPPSNSRLTKSQLLHFSFAFYFHLWGEKAGLPLLWS